jgi:hypothetical protein
MVTSRIWFTATQKAELWERWKSGLSGSRNAKRFPVALRAGQSIRQVAMALDGRRRL